VLQAISAAEVDLSGNQPHSGAEWGGRSAAYWGRPLDWEGAAAEELPTRQQMRDFLDHVREKVDASSEAVGYRVSTDCGGSRHLAPQ
jgi:hypothetical protein